MDTATRKHSASASLIAVSVLTLLTGCASAGVEAAPAVKATSTPAACPNPYGGTCLGPLSAGEYHTKTFAPAISYVVPDGWMNMEDLPGNFWLYLQEDSAGQTTSRGGSYLGIYNTVYAASIECLDAPQEGVPASSGALMEWYQSLPGLITSEPVPVTVGGLDGLQIDLTLREGDQTCSLGGNYGVPLIIGNGVSDLHHVMGEEMDIRLVVLDWGEGNVTLEITNVREQHSADEFRSELQPIIDSLVFEE